MGVKQKRADGLELRVYTQPPGHRLSEELCKQRQHLKHHFININVLLILKMRKIILLRANYFIGHFKGYFEGVKKVEALSKYPEKWPIKVICPKTVNNAPNFHNQWYIGNFMSHCDQMPTIFFSSIFMCIQQSWQEH